MTKAPALVTKAYVLTNEAFAPVTKERSLAFKDPVLLYFAPKSA